MAGFFGLRLAALAVAGLCAAVSDPPAARAMHLKQAGAAELERALERRLHGFPARFRQIPIAAAATPRTLPRAVETLPAGIRALLEDGSAISLLYYDGAAVKYDWKRGDIAEDLPLYGASMSKSITSWLVGRALCDGHIRSLDDAVADYVPALADTFYGRVALRDALDMTAGDRPLYADSARGGGRSRNREYNGPVMRGAAPVLDALRGFPAREPGVREFAYRNANTDAVALALGKAVLGGLGAYAERTLVRDAGFAHPAMYLGDRDGAAFAFAMFYAARTDWLRAAIRIGEDYSTGGCIGEYLRGAVDRAAPVGFDRHPYRRYGRFFWSGRKRAERPHLAMLGHGGQRGFIGLDAGRVLLIMAITGNYKPWRVYRALFE